MKIENASSRHTQITLNTRGGGWHCIISDRTYSANVFPTAGIRESQGDITCFKIMKSELINITRMSTNNMKFSPMGPSDFLSSDWSMMCTIIGHRYAAVLPLPVFAIPIRSRPLSATGMAWA